MKKIIVNGRFLLHRVTGVERYAREILLELDKIIKPGEIEMAIPPEVDEIPSYKNIKVIKIGKLKNRMWEHISFPIYVLREKAISLNLCNVGPLPSPGITCIFDMKIHAHPEFFSKKFVLWYKILFFNAIYRGKLIITDSKTAKKDIMKYYPYVNPKKIKVIYPAWQHFERIGYDEDTLSKYNLTKEKYYFAMGSMDPNKNFKWIAKAAQKNPDMCFAIAGSVNEDVFADGMGFECPENMKLLGYVSDEEAKTLMRDCKAFLFPTIYEGFGIPPLEAISTGCTCVIVSDTEVMHEVFGKAVIYINPKKANLPLALNRDKGYEEILEKYSWKKISAPRLLKIIREIK